MMSCRFVDLQANNLLDGPIPAALVLPTTLQVCSGKERGVGSIATHRMVTAQQSNVHGHCEALQCISWSQPADSVKPLFYMHF